MGAQVGGCVLRILIDVLGAPTSSGGMRLYAEELIKAWSLAHPEDQLIVLGGPWITPAFDGLVSVEPVVRREGTAWRVLGQWIGTAVQARSRRVDAVLSVSLIVSPFVGDRPRICVVHDWRHVKQPGEFSPAQRAYRKLWAWSTNHATRAVQISPKTDQETAAIAPRARRVIIENGQDHARAWPVAERDETCPATVVTFGHQTNKRPDLVIQAMALAETKTPTTLIVLGAAGEYATELRALAQRLGIDDRVDFPGFVQQPTYQQIIQRASVIVLASTDEGFGLPVSEGAYFGIPVVSTDDNGIDIIHGDRATCVPPTPQDLGRAISAALYLGQATAQGRGSTWLETATRVRAVVSSLR